MPSAPPINSATTSISGSAAIAAASSYQRAADSSTPRSRRRSRAETAATTSRRPPRRANRSASPCNRRKTPPPTVPRPATAILSGGFTATNPVAPGGKASVLEQHLGVIAAGRCLGRRRLDRDPGGRDAGLGEGGGNRLRLVESGTESGQRVGGANGPDITDDAQLARMFPVEGRDLLQRRQVAVAQALRAGGEGDLG